MIDEPGSPAAMPVRLAAGLFASVAAACVPVPSVVGRSAGILPQGYEMESCNGGIYGRRWQREDMEEAEDGGFG